MKNHYDALKTFGAGRDHLARDWQDYLLQMLQMGFFEVAYNEHGAMKVTSQGWRVLKDEMPVQLVLLQKKTDEIPVVHARKVSSKKPKAAEGSLFERLRQLRKRLADEQGYPPYIVLSDQSLHELASVKPRTMEQFGMIHGIGEYKRKKYGEIFLKEIRKVDRQEGEMF